MEHEHNELNWYKTSLMKIADEIGSPQTGSIADIQKLVKNATGNYFKKESAQIVNYIIKNTEPHSDERDYLLLKALSKMDVKNDDAKIISGILTNMRSC